MALASHIARALQPMVDLAYPPRCPLCGEASGTQDGLCLDCWSALEQPGEPACASCQRPLGDNVTGFEDAVCAPCMTTPPRHAGIAAATLYNDTSRRLVLSFKHGGRIALAAMMGRLMAARLGELGEEHLLIPVPLHRWRIWGRGYNQSALLATELVKITRAQVMLDGLERHKPTPSLGGLGRKARAKALKGAIRVKRSRANAIQRREIILVDDVLTSGATANACVGALLKGGAKSVRISCFARVVDGEAFAAPMEASLVETIPGPENETPGIR